jgi:hypothetical protein
VGYLKGSRLEKGAALLVNIRLGWNKITGANTLAYCKYLKITSVKLFLSLAPEGNVIKIFASINNTAVN